MSSLALPSSTEWPIGQPNALPIEQLDVIPVTLITERFSSLSWWAFVLEQVEQHAEILYEPEWGRSGAVLSR